jgi:hypothetical protein
LAFSSLIFLNPSSNIFSEINERSFINKNQYSTSCADPRAISKKWTKSLSVFLPHPSAMHKGIEYDARLIWLVKSYCSDLGNSGITLL